MSLAMKNLTPLAAAVALLALAACDNKITAPAPATNAANAADAAAAAKVALPPSIKSSKPYRCKDDSIVTIAFLEGDLQANVTESGTAPTILKAPAAGEPFVAAGYDLTASGDTVTLTRPNHPKQDCKG